MMMFREVQGIVDLSIHYKLKYIYIVLIVYIGCMT